MADLDSFLTDFTERVIAVNQLIQSIPTQPTEALQRSTLNQAASQRNALTEMLNEQTISIRRLPYLKRREASKQLDPLGNQIDQISLAIGEMDTALRQRKFRLNNQSVRTQLMGDGSSRRVERSNDQRERLLNVHDMMERGDQSIKQTNRMIEQSIEVGTATNTTLLTQREQFVHQIDQLESSNQSVERSNRVMDRMRWRAFTGQILACVFIILLIIGCGIVTWLKYFR